MNVKKYILFILVFSSMSWAQIPTGYYNTATGTGLTLKTQLKKIENIEIMGPVDSPLLKIKKKFSFKNRD